MRVKGKIEPVPIWRALRPRSRFGVGVDLEPSTPMVNREVELTLLTVVYERAVRESSVQLVNIVGEPGVGKSRLVREFRAWIDARPELVPWRQGRCLPYGEGITFWALGEVVKAQAEILESDDVAVAAQKLAQAVEQVGIGGAEREWLTRRLGLLVGLVGGEEATADNREEIFTAWRRFLEAIAAQRQFIVVFEDLHWADPALLAFTRHLVEWASGVPLLVVTTARPELYDRSPDWGGGLRNATTISLEPLSDADTARLVTALLNQAMLPAEAQATLVEQTGVTRCTPMRSCACWASGAPWSARVGQYDSASAPSWSSPTPYRPSSPPDWTRSPPNARLCSRTPPWSARCSGPGHCAPWATETLPSSGPTSTS